MRKTVKASLAAGAWLLAAAVVAVAMAMTAAAFARGQAPPGYEWRAFDDDADQCALLFAGRQVGTWRHDTGAYHPYDGRGWGAAARPPVAPPSPPTVVNHGVLADPRPAGGERWSVSGKVVAPEEGRNVLADPAPVPADGDRPWLVVVGDGAFQARVAKDLAAPAVRPLAAGRRVAYCEPGDWQARDRDGKVCYTPGVWLAGASGGKARHLESYATPEQLAEGIRKCAPDYDPAKAPDPLTAADAPWLASPAAATGASAALTSLLLGAWTLTRKWRSV